jgi:hypothetical protein
MIDDARMSSVGVALQLAARRGFQEPLGVLPSSPGRGSAPHARVRQETWSLARRFGCGEHTRSFCSTARAARTVVIADVTALSEDDASPLGQGGLSFGRRYASVFHRKKQLTRQMRVCCSQRCATSQDGASFSVDEHPRTTRR